MAKLSAERETPKRGTPKAGAPKRGAPRGRPEPRGAGPVLTVRRWLLRALWAALAFAVLLIVLFKFVNPPTTPYMFSERLRLGHVDQRWTPISKIAPVMARSVVAAEDANFCEHWGFDMAAIRAAAEAGAHRGGSTISQQVVKNVFLWQGHSWVRKALEAALTPMVELIWGKRRILEIYLNVAELDEGGFGVAAGAARYFRAEPDRITAQQAALLAVMLPDPKGRDAAHPTSYLRQRAAEVEDGAATIRIDGRAKCFED